jgi:23S rRNA (guanine745-N1)-methyltransferase
MVAARHLFLQAGHFEPLSVAIAAAAEDLVHAQSGCVIDVGAGTGYYLAALLDRLPGHWAVALDASRHALRRAVRAHPKIAAVACDVWQPFPLRSGVVDLVLNVFAPRNPPEIARVLSPNGVLVVVTPDATHLRELVEPLAMLSVDSHKAARLHGDLARHFDVLDRKHVRSELLLRHDHAEALVRMGPSARHLTTDELARRLARLPEPVSVTLSAHVEAFQSRAPRARGP